LRFELGWWERRVAGGTQTPRRFLDFIVDGASLYERHGSDLIGCLGWFDAVEDDRAAARLLRDEPPEVDGRVAVYVCPECADLDCGAITVAIERQGPAIVWRAPALTTPDDEAGGWHHDEGELADWPELRFDAREYWSAIASRPRMG
jgi:hypothetical protein